MPMQEWCPPGHGDIYSALLGSGMIDRLLQDGVQYLFVSNSDNLGATLDTTLLHFFAESGKPFLMEVGNKRGLACDVRVSTGDAALAYLCHVPLLTIVRGPGFCRPYKVLLMAH